MMFLSVYYSESAVLKRKPETHHYASCCCVSVCFVWHIPVLTSLIPVFKGVSITEYYCILNAAFDARILCGCQVLQRIHPHCLKNDMGAHSFIVTGVIGPTCNQRYVGDTQQRLFV